MLELSAIRNLAKAWFLAVFLFVLPYYTIPLLSLTILLSTALSCPESRGKISLFTFTGFRRSKTVDLIRFGFL